MIDIRPDHLQIVKEILEEYVPACKVCAFGSRVNGIVKSYSDLDLVIMAKEKLDRRLLYRLQEAFQESKLPFRVDVLDWNRISESFRKVIGNKYHIIQNAKEAVEDAR